MTTPTEQTADQLNTACARLQAATEARLKAKAAHTRLSTEAMHQALLVDEAIAAQDRAIDASAEDPETVIPNVDRAACELAERKARAAETALTKAHQAQTEALEALAQAERAHKAAVCWDAYLRLQKEIAKLPQLATVLALQSDADIGAELFAQGVRIQLDPQTRGVILRAPLPSKVLGSAEAAASALSAKAHPAALAHYQGKAAADRKVVSEAQRQKLLGDEAHELHVAEETLRSQSAHNPAMAIALKAKHLAEVATIKARYITQRAAL